MQAAAAQGLRMLQAGLHSVVNMFGFAVLHWSDHLCCLPAGGGQNIIKAVRPLNVMCICSKCFVMQTLLHGTPVVRT